MHGGYFVNLIREWFTCDRVWRAIVAETYGQAAMAAFMDSLAAMAVTKFVNGLQYPLVYCLF